MLISKTQDICHLGNDTNRFLQILASMARQNTKTRSAFDEIGSWKANNNNRQAAFKAFSGESGNLGWEINHHGDNRGVFITYDMQTQLT